MIDPRRGPAGRPACHDSDDQEKHDRRHQGNGVGRGGLEEETARGAFPFVLHCFTGGAELARSGLALGGYVSFSGVVTFKNSEALRDIAKDVPLDRLLVETDAPYLAPEPLRGRTNEPANVVHTAKRLADVRGLSEAEIAAATTDNFFRLFKKVPRSAASTPSSA